MKKLFFTSLTLVALLSGCASSSHVYYRAKVHDFINDNASQKMALVVDKIEYLNDFSKKPPGTSLKSELETSLVNCINTRIRDETTMKVVGGKEEGIGPGEINKPGLLEKKDFNDIRYVMIVNLGYEIHDTNRRSESGVAGEVSMVGSYKGRSTTVDIRSQVHDVLKKKQVVELDINSWGAGKTGGGVVLIPFPIPFPYLVHESAFEDACDLLGELVRQAIVGELVDKN